jgi:large subunit ribosomal protein L35
MPKIKTHKGAAKRVKKTATGKLMHDRQGKSHFMLKKAPGRKRGISKSYEIGSTHVKAIKSLLGV